MRADLRSELIEPEEPCEQDDENSGDADRWIDADDHAEGETPGEAARGYPSAKEAEEWAEDFAAEKLADGFGDEEHTEFDVRRGGGVGVMIAFGEDDPGNCYGKSDVIFQLATQTGIWG